MKFPLTPLQIIGIVLIVNGALIGSVAQLTDLFGPGVAKIVISVATLGNSIFGGIVTMLSGQATQIRNVVGDPQAQEALIKAVLGMRGVESIAVNGRASQTLAAIAVDPNVDKIAPTQSAMESVTRTAASAPNAG